MALRRQRKQLQRTAVDLPLGTLGGTPGVAAVCALGFSAFGFPQVSGRERVEEERASGQINMALSMNTDQHSQAARSLAFATSTRLDMNGN